MSVPRLLLLTDRSQLPPGGDLAEVVRACVGAGLSHVVVRERDLEPDARERLLAGLASIDGLTVISSRLPAAAAHGLHLAAAQEPPTTGWFGRSCHDAEDVRRAAAEGATYVTLSPFAATASKPGYGPPVPRQHYADDHGVPVLALGGVDPRNARAALAAGAHGVAVMGCVMRAAEPAAVVRDLLREVER
jgi:thiamine-phosphate pyrophosphorylase